jgi:transposase
VAEAGWAAARTHDNYLAAQYANIARRRGKKRARVAVGHSILVIAYYVLSQPDVRYQDLGSDYFTVKRQTPPCSRPRPTSCETRLQRQHRMECCLKTGFS